MKLLISTFFAMGFSASAFASNIIPEYAPETIVSQRDRSDYKEALLDAYNISSYDSICNKNILRVLKGAWHINMDLHLLTSPSPLLVVRAVEDPYIGDYEFHTDSQMTKITKIVLTTYKLNYERVNTGNLKNPKFEDVRKEEITFNKTCEAVEAP